MTNEEMLRYIMEHCEKLSSHEEQLKSLHETTKEIKQLAESTYKIATSVEVLTNEMSGIKGRLGEIEENKKQKNFTLWQIVAWTAIGAVGTLVINILTQVLTSPAVPTP